MEWLQATPLAVYIHQTKWAFTTIEVVHVIAISVVIGSIAIVDLRLLGLASTKRPFTELAREVLPWTWTAFVVAAVGGPPPFFSPTTPHFSGPRFLVQKSVIALAGVKILVFVFI